MFRWQVLALLLVALPLVTLFFTGVTQRFGTKGFGVLWLLLWGGCMLIPAALGSAADGGTSLLARLGERHPVAGGLSAARGLGRRGRGADRCVWRQ